MPDLARDDGRLLEMALNELSARQRLDLLDAQWERDMGKHIRRQRGGRLYVANRSDGFIFMVAGMCLAGYGVHMLIALVGGPQKWAFLPALFFFGAILAAGATLVAVGVRALRRVGLHRQERARYEAERKLLVEQLPSEFQRAGRFCPNCLNRE